MEGMAADFLYVRFQSTTVNARGIQVGIFNLANGLARKGILSAQDWTWWRKANDWYDAAYVHPSAVDATVYDPAVNPLSRAWFKASAHHLLDRVPGYCDLLDRYGIGWEEVRTADPGKIIYEDEVQIVAVPR